MAQSRSFVDPAAISKHLHCTICTEVFSDPQRLPCEHLFCRQCILSWAEQHANCPQCRRKFIPKKLTRDLLAANLIAELKVRCESKGCCWVGPAGELPQHAENCIFQPGREAASLISSSQATGPSLLSKLFERDPNRTKAFLSHLVARPQVTFFDLSDEENRSS